MTAICGWLGAICLGLCGLPQAIKTIRTKKADDISAWFLGLWIVGELLTLIYVLPKADAPLIFNYLLNIVLVGIIVRYKL